MRELAACFGEGTSELRAIVVEAASRPTFRRNPPRNRIGRRRRQRIANRLRPRSNPSPLAARAPAGAGPSGSADGTVLANAGGWLHNIAGEAYVVLPDGCAAFAALEGLDAKTVRNQVARLNRHRERKTPSGNANTFRAELAEDRRVDGMVLPGNLIWDDEPTPLVADALGRRRQRARRTAFGCAPSPPGSCGTGPRHGADAGSFRASGTSRSAAGCVTGQPRGRRCGRTTAGGDRGRLGRGRPVVGPLVPGSSGV